MPLYSFAGLTVDMLPQYPTLRRNAAPYLLHEDVRPDIRIRQPADYAQKMQEACPLFTPDLAEYVRFATLFYRALIRRGGMMLHASAVALDGRAYLFSAPSGTGKSTHTAAWLRLFDGAFLINDDKPALRVIDGALCACGTPFSGKYDLSRNVCVPVGGICVLDRGTEDRIRRIPAREAVAPLLEQTIRRGLGAEDTALLLDVVKDVIARAPIYRMQCTPSDDAARLSHRAMAGES